MNENDNIHTTNHQPSTPHPDPGMAAFWRLAEDLLGADVAADEDGPVFNLLLETWLQMKDAERLEAAAHIRRLSGLPAE